MTPTPLSPDDLLYAYTSGYFPMAEPNGEINFYCPRLRGILPFERFHIPRSLRRRLNQKPYEIRVNTAFRAVMQACADPAPGREDTWINPTLIELYSALHQRGYVHSVEAWQNGVLVGGLYGVSLGGLFAGESMFARAPDASKIALVHLVRRLQAGGYTLLDTQMVTPHMERFGAINILHQRYMRQLESALSQPATFFPDGF